MLSGTATRAEVSLRSKPAYQLTRSAGGGFRVLRGIRHQARNVTADQQLTLLDPQYVVERAANRSGLFSVSQITLQKSFSGYGHPLATGAGYRRRAPGGQSYEWTTGFCFALPDEQ